MTFCPQCGKEVAQGTRFCENCGAPLSPGAAGNATASNTVHRLTALDIAQDPLLRNYKPIDPPADLQFRLQDGEVILKAIKPSRKIIVRSAIRSIIGAVVFGIFLPSR